MSGITKSAMVGLVVGFLGLIVAIAPFGTALEESLGLHLLFKLRGVRRVPSDVVIITMDKQSADRLDLPDSPRKWPRAMHARLVEKLIEKEAAVIAFDIIFSENRSAEDDQIFARAIQDAGNVVLADWLKTDRIPVFDASGAQSGNLEIERLIPPIAPLESAAVASAPFALPKVPVKVNSYWAFKAGAGDTPTLPVVVFQVFAMRVYDQFYQLLKEVDKIPEQLLPSPKEDVLTDKNVRGLIFAIRNYLEQNPEIAAKMLAKLETSKTAMADQKDRRLLTSLIRMYQDPKSRYLNFYGPPGTLPTISYYRLLDLPVNFTAIDQIVLKGKAVFIGLSEHLRPELKDGFYTVFSKPEGLDISGVEIAATAFANIMEDKPIRPVKTGQSLLMIFFWGLLAGVGCILPSATIVAGGAVLFSGIYLFVALYFFRHSGLWLPLVIPLFIQIPTAFFGAVFFKFFEANKERQNIRTAFGYYLPDNVVDQLSKSISNVTQSTQLVYGTCLITDAEQYTALSEFMDPEDLARFINKYYEVIFQPVRKNSGIISDVKGDSILAIWAAGRPEKTIRSLACQAALEIIRGVNEFNTSTKDSKLPTRIGIHSGYISLGHVGAIDHYEYRPVGDIVNTASRVEGLNKYIGTKILVSEDVVEQLEGFLIRKIGKFVLAGKTNPITVCELICQIEQSNEKQKNLRSVFDRALDAYQKQSWNEAMKLFQEVEHIYAADGPSHFYLKLCEDNRSKSLPDNWDGTVHLNFK